MEAYSNAHHAHTPTRHLTKLYSDAKKSALTSIEIQSNATQQFSALHRKYRIQKDRLITWGLEWSDDEKGPDGNIDESVARAGLTETVDSVLRNIKEVTDEAERIKVVSVPGLVTKPGEKNLPPVPFDEARYEDLLRDLTTSIDTLYDLSRSRKALARGEHPTFNPPPEEKPESKSSGSKVSSIRKSLFRKPSYASSEQTLVNPPPFSRPTLSPYAGLPPRLEVNALRLPEEGPPPYEALGVPSTTRLVGTLIRAKASELIQNALGSNAAEIPVLVEYANFDSTYRDTGVPPPLRRLESLAMVFQPMRPESQTNLSLLGYFEDMTQPRIGLVYDLPYSIQNRLQGNIETAPQTLAPLSLLKLVQKANKAQPTNAEGNVPLEDRFRIALRLTEQLHVLHSRGVAHGNINSSSVIFTTAEHESPTSRQKQLRSPLWALFDLFSKCSVEGIRRAVNLNIYKHPDDDPHNPGRSMSVDLKFDMYGLALLLLEVGLWTPLGDLYKAKYSLADFKLRLEKLWIPKLASRCGSAYMRAVQACLAAADDLDLSGSTTVIESAYEILIRNLERCCSLDESAPMDPILPIESFSDSASAASSTKVKRKPVPAGISPLSRQQSDPNELLRTQSMSSTTSSVVSRLSSLPNLPPLIPPVVNPSLRPASEYPASRYLSDLRQPPRRESISQLKRKLSQRFSSPPSFKEYKRKVTLIQQKWREYRARCLDAQAGLAGGPTISRNTNDGATEQPVKPKRKEFPQIALPQAVVDDWHKRASIQLAKLVEKALKGSPESSSIALTAYGETPETARPTFLVCCTSTARVKHVLKHRFKFDSSICDVRVKKDEIRRCRKSRRGPRNEEAQRSMAPSYGEVWQTASNPDYQERPLCGASIGAFRGEEHLPPVSFGGVVVVDGTSYGMSVHHMLEAEDDEEGENIDDDADDESDTSSLRSFDGISISSESDDESTVRPPSTVPDMGPSADGHEGDCPGIVPGDFEDIAITQPALDDAIDLDLHVDEDDDDEEDSGIDEDHLLSYKLGQVHASSGLKRSASSLEGGFRSIGHSLPQEIDWALFELVPPRIHPFNIIKGGSEYCILSNSAGRDTYPVAIRGSAELACAKVHCLGRTSGLASGVISSTMELVKIHGRSTFSASWTVDGEFGVGGDSGAWVISNDDGKVCGHVVAFRRGRAYICPMDLLLDDIKTTLGAKQVLLPTILEVETEDKVDARAEEQFATDAIRNLRLVEATSGGVALPGNHDRPSSGRSHFSRAFGTVEAAG